MVRQKGLAMNLGAADYLTKPVEWVRLKAVFERYQSSSERAVALVVEDDEGTRAALRWGPRRRGLVRDRGPMPAGRHR
jgi:DNA-binding response OmpR family regulator